VSADAAAPWRQFICRACGLVYDERVGDADSGLAAGTRWEDIAPDWACPICGVGKADFEPYVPAPAPRRPLAPAPVRVARGAAGVVIVGAGRAGWAVAHSLREQGCTAPVTLVTACAGDVYNKPQLSVAVAQGIAPGKLVREPAAAAAARLGVRLLSGAHAVAIDNTARRLRTTRVTLRYGHLVLAQGAEPALPAALPPALVWRVNDLTAYQRLRAALATGAQEVLIVGAGLVGCELANDLALAGHRITLLDMQPQPLAAQLPAAAGLRLLQAWQALPIRFLGGAQVRSVERCSPPERALRVTLHDGRCLQADQVLAATGLRANGRLARSAGLAYDSAAGGLAVDAATGRTSVPGIYALGDCAVVDGQASRYIEPIARQARAIAAHIVHGAVPPVAVVAAPVLRVKTSALPISVSGAAGQGGPWQMELDTPTELRMARFGPQGERVASLLASLPRAAWAP
jgi:rubredoxin---NAD+ reductase